MCLHLPGTYVSTPTRCTSVCVYMCPLCTHVYANVPCVAVCCRVLQCVAVCCRVLQCLTVSSVLKCVTVCSSAVQCAAVRRIHICALYNPSNPTPPPPATPARCRRHAYRVARINISVGVEQKPCCLVLAVAKRTVQRGACSLYNHTPCRLYSWLCMRKFCTNKCVDFLCMCWL